MRMRMVSSILIIAYQELRGDYNRPVDVSVLAESYHTKNYEGTTTGSEYSIPVSISYHTKNYEGTTTAS